MGRDQGTAGSRRRALVVVPALVLPILAAVFFLRQGVSPEAPRPSVVLPKAEAASEPESPAPAAGPVRVDPAEPRRTDPERASRAPAPAAVDTPPWTDRRPPEVVRAFEQSRVKFLEEIATDLSLTEPQRALLQARYREREEEAAGLNEQGRAGVLDLRAYAERIGLANERFYDRFETCLGPEQRLLLQRFRNRSRQATQAIMPPSESR
jgi:hypothetical protein